MLGGAVTPDIAAARNDVALNEAAERMTAAVELARRYPNARIIFSGGDGSLVYGGNESDAALRLFERLGLPPGRVELEDQSRNTFENRLVQQADSDAEAGRALASGDLRLSYAAGDGHVSAGRISRSKPIRSIGVRAASRTHARPFPSLGDGLRRTDTAVREWVGLALYWLTGRSSELFPGPSARRVNDRALSIKWMRPSRECDLFASLPAADFRLENSKFLLAKIVRLDRRC